DAVAGERGHHQGQEPDAAEERKEDDADHDRGADPEQDPLDVLLRLALAAVSLLLAGAVGTLLPDDALDRAARADRRPTVRTVQSGGRPRMTRTHGLRARSGRLGEVLAHPAERRRHLRRPGRL